MELVTRKYYIVAKLVMYSIITWKQFFSKHIDFKNKKDSKNSELVLMINIKILNFREIYS